MMQDFAYLFPDSVAAWLRGQGDGRFQRYDRYYRSDRARALCPDVFDLEKSNELFSVRSRSAQGRVAAAWNSKSFRVLAMFLILLCGGSLMLPRIGPSQPLASGAVICIAFVGLRARKLKSLFWR
jgi:hypothetical protein